MPNFLIGADPELFVYNNQTRKYISAHNLLPGTKAEPHKVLRGAVQVDGTAAEFNIDATKNVRSFVTNIKTVRGILDRMVKEHNENYVVTAVPTVHYNVEYFHSLPEKARELGCDPDFNAYTKRENLRPNEGFNFRTGSGHIHIGWTNGADPREPEFFDFCCSVVKELDVSLGLGSLLWDNDGQRRQMYGRPGAFRPKHYGLEYRVLSNAWLKDESLMRWVFNTTQKTLNLMIKEKYPSELVFGRANNKELARVIIANNLVFRGGQYFDRWVNLFGDPIEV